MKRERGSTIHRVLDILDTIAAAEKPVSATEINESLKLPKATAHRLCGELETRGYLLKEINGKNYMPGNRLHEMAVGVLANSCFSIRRHSILEALSRKVGETCNIAYPDGLNMAYSDRVETQHPLKLNFSIDTRVPLHCTASGKLFLASMPQKKRREVIAKLDLHAHTRNTMTDPEQILEETEQIRTSNVSVDNQEYFEGMIAIGVPITDHSGRFYSSVAIQAPIFRFSLDDARQQIPLLREAAQDLSHLTEG